MKQILEIQHWGNLEYNIPFQTKINYRNEKGIDKELYVDRIYGTEKEILQEAQTLVNNTN